MKINALLIILIYFQFFFCFDLIKASKTKSEINLKESIHFAEKLSNIKVNKSDKKRNPSMDDETNEFTEETETDKKDNQKKSKDNKELITSENNSNIIINERKKFLDDTKNLPKNKNSATINSIDNSDYIGIGLDKIESYDYLKISDLGPGPIFASGWIKYFKFKANSKDNKNIIDNDSKSTLQIIETEQSKNLPKSFIMNMEYEQEKRLTPQNDYNSKSSDGINILNDYIQDKYLFYAILMKDAFNIVSSRKVIITY